MAVFQVPGPSVPGLAIPGDASAGYPGGVSAGTSYLFGGQVTLYYLQYLGPGGTLAAVPGQAYQQGSLAEASGLPYGLPVPPGDGRWVTQGGGQILYEILLLEPREDAAAALARARAVNVALQARLAAGGTA